MNATEFLAKWKTHLIFAGVFLSVLIFNSTFNLAAGQSLLTATWNAIREITPMEYAMLVLFWYFCAVRRPEDEWGTSLTTLNLGRSDR
jgi:hypothetical protein